ncbi:MAG: hypothetical protein CMJ44_02215, partial [Pimelobacter sp.]|nr:hypothetical protein [Pimelobacter sp.]
MATDPRDPPFEPFAFTPDAIAGLMKWQTEAAQQMMNGGLPFLPQPGSASDGAGDPFSHWQAMTAQATKVWEQQLAAMPQTGELPSMKGMDPARWTAAFQDWWQQLAGGAPQIQGELWSETLQLWNAISQTYGIGTASGPDKSVDAADLPRQDRRFADPKWRADPVFALMHQTYLLIAEKLGA